MARKIIYYLDIFGFFGQIEIKFLSHEWLQYFHYDAKCLYSSKVWNYLIPVKCINKSFWLSTTGFRCWFGRVAIQKLWIGDWSNFFMHILFVSCNEQVAMGGWNKQIFSSYNMSLPPTFKFSWIYAERHCVCVCVCVLEQIERMHCVLNCTHMSL